MGPQKSGIHTLHKQSINATYHRASKDAGMGKHMQYSSTEWLPHKSNTEHKREEIAKQNKRPTRKNEEKTEQTEQANNKKMGNIHIPQPPNKEGN